MSHSNPIVAYYDDLAKNYDADRFGNSYGKFIDRKERKLLDRLVGKHGEAILDLACGSGRFLDYATIGIDASEEMILVARKKYPKKTYFVSDAAQIPLGNECVDTIITFHFFMHLDADKVNSILRECHRVLKPGGRIIFDIPSAKRRKHMGYKANGWHGAFSLSFAEIESIPGFQVKSKHGILFLPIHRFPVFLRPLLAPIDWVLTNALLKEYSSYLILELEKQA